MAFELHPYSIRGWSHPDTLFTPLAYRAMDLMTEEILNPTTTRPWVDDYGHTTRQMVTVPVEMEFMESMTRRVFGALCYAGLFVAVIVEVIVRIVLAIVALPFTLPLLAWQECEESWAMFCVGQVVIGVMCLIDAPVRTISALVQKCLTDQRLKYGSRKQWHELHIC
ncbi:MAG: hypothetical protein HYX48_05745 [Chlamydiales bacterium]|nr:hypothetical protein [Chlamydiales bacterium]